MAERTRDTSRAGRRGALVAWFGLCLGSAALPAVAVAECATYEMQGELWFSDRRVQTLTPAVWATLGPAPNVRVYLGVAGFTVFDIAQEQPHNFICPAGVDCNAEDFDDFEGATDIYVGLDGHWAMDVTLCLREPHSSYPLTLRPRFIYETPRWRVVDTDGEVFAVAGRARHPIAPGVVDYGYTFVPFFTRAEKAMWVFQSAREVWSFIAVDGGCSPERGFVQTCGFELGRKVNVYLAFQSEMLQCSAHGCYFGDDWVWPYLCNQEEECLLVTNDYVWKTVYHEYGHFALDIAMRSKQPEYWGYGYPWSAASEDWARFVGEYAVVGLRNQEHNFCELGIPLGVEKFWGDLFDPMPADCAPPALGSHICDYLVVGVGHLLDGFGHMTDVDLTTLQIEGNGANIARRLEIESGTGLGDVKPQFVATFVQLYAVELLETWTERYSMTVATALRPYLYMVLLMNCVPVP